MWSENKGLPQIVKEWGFITVQIAEQLIQTHLRRNVVSEFKYVPPAPFIISEHSKQRIMKGATVMNTVTYEVVI